MTSASRRPHRRRGDRQQHTELAASPRLVDLAGAMVDHFGEPFGNPTALLIDDLSRKARQHVTVALVGDGGDEVFAGYPRYRGGLLAQRYRQPPGGAAQHRDAARRAHSGEQQRPPWAAPGARVPRRRQPARCRDVCRLGRVFHAGGAPRDARGDKPAGEPDRDALPRRALPASRSMRCSRPISAPSCRAICWPMAMP